MAKQKFSGLGRGLDTLISGASEVMAARQPVPSAEIEPSQVAIDSIIPNPRQPRRAFREDDPKLLELSASIKEHGLIQPIIVTPLEKVDESQHSQQAANAWLGDDIQPTEQVVASIVKYQIIAGERRWRASRLAGLSKVPVVIKDVTPQQMLELALIENIQRADLNPIEEALAYQTLKQDFGLTQEAIARRVGKERSTVANTMRLLDLTPKVRDALINMPEAFTEGHARALIGVNSEEAQTRAMEQIVAQRMTVREAEALAGRLKQAEESQASEPKMLTPLPRPVEMSDLENHFRTALMVKVDLKCNAKGKGTLVLHFNSQDELESLYGLLVKNEE